MDFYEFIFTAIYGFVLSIGVVWFVIRISARVGLLARVEARSSHTVPTPQGGGLGPAAVAVTSGLYLAVMGYGWTDYALLSGLCCSVAILGLADDILGMSASFRLLLQAIIVFLLLYILSPLPPFDLPGFKLEGTLLGALMLLVGLWWINLYNFMDGLDGLAGSQAVFMLGSCVLLALNMGASVDDRQILWMIGVIFALLAFLLFNWQPAKIFLGDSGSLFLGLFILINAIMTIQADLLDYASWSVLAAVFVCDSTVTLLIRLGHGVKVTTTHSHHTFNRLARRWKSHKRVTVLSTSFNVFWLLPLAWYVNGNDSPWQQVVVIIIAYAPILLAVCSIQFRYKDYRITERTL